MKKIYSVLGFILLVGHLWGQNSLLENPITKSPFTQGKIDEIEIIANEEDVALATFNRGTGHFYVFDLKDNAAEDASKNEVTTIANLSGIISGATGQTGLYVDDIQVNPISKAIYVLVTDGFMNAHVVKIEENGDKAEVLDLAKLPHSKITWGGDEKFNVQDMAWGNSGLYITSGSNFSLDGEIAWTSAPFAHESSTTNRATSMFKTNWGGQYYTNAPLEKLDFGTIDGEDRLLGVTLCAPGFSIKTSDLKGSDVLEVTEDFNIRFNSPTKVVYQGDGDNHWLFNLHGGTQLIRIGKKYIDGSQVEENNYNNNTQHLRTTTGAPTPGLGEDEVKVYAERYDMIAAWSDGKLLVLRNNELSLMTTVDGVGISKTQGTALVSLYPNPASNEVVFDFSQELLGAQLQLTTLEGKEVLKQQVLPGKMTVDVSSLPKGTYVVQVIDPSQKTIFTNKVTIVD